MRAAELDGHFEQSTYSYQENLFFFLRKKLKREANIRLLHLRMESLILAQDERWRRA